MVALADADAGNLAALAAAAALGLFRPVPALGAQIQGLGHVGAGHRTLVGVQFGVRVGRVDAPDGHPVEPQFLGGLVHHRLENSGDLVLPGPALGAPGRGVGEHRHRAQAQRLGLVKDADRAAGGGGVAASALRPQVLNDVEVHGGNPAVGGEARLDPALEADPGRADVVLLLAGDAQHDRTAKLLGEVRGQGHDGVGEDLGAEAAAAVLTDVNQVLRGNANHGCQERNDEALALGGPVHEALAVLPVAHHRAWLHGHVRVAGGDEALREDHGGVVEARLKIAVLPLDGRFGGGLAASQEALHLVLAPMQFADLGRAAGVDVAFPAGIGAGRPQAVGWVDGEGQGFEFDVNAADGVLRGLLVHRRHCQNGIADEHRLVGQDAAIGCFHRR